MQMQKARGIMKLVEALSQLTLRSGQRCSIRRFEVWVLGRFSGAHTIQQLPFLQQHFSPKVMNCTFSITPATFFLATTIV